MGFWEQLQNAYVKETSLDLHLQGKDLNGKVSTTIRDLTDIGRSENALPLPCDSGTRVRFNANIGSVMSYDDIPADGIEGSVILVKTAMGKMTSYDGKVFVLWDDGKFRSIFADHLRLAGTSKKMSNNFRMVVADFGDLSDLFTVKSSDELIHKSTKDLWSFSQGDNGFVIERLFNDDGKPLKI